MSADNYYVIKHHPYGGYAAVQGFFSDESVREARKSDYSFGTHVQAYSWARDENSEHGVRFDQDVLDEMLADADGG